MTDRNLDLTYVTIEPKARMHPLTDEQQEDMAREILCARAALRSTDLLTKTLRLLDISALMFALKGDEETAHSMQKVVKTGYAYLSTLAVKK